MKQNSEIHQYDFIDALRGIAILLVIATHVAPIAHPSLPILRMIAQNGAYGVQLFYIVSALTLFLSINQRSHLEKSPIRNFFIRRLFRIVPLFYFSMLLYTLVFGTGPSYWAPDGLKWWHYALTLLFLNGWHPEAINAIVPLGWSIAIEMTFYPFIPFLYQRIKNISGAIFLITASLVLQVLLVIFYKPILLNYATGYIVQAYFYLWFFAQLPIFGLGILVYLILKEKPERNLQLGNALLVFFAFLYIAFLQTGSYVESIPHHFFYGIAFLLLTLGLYFNPTKLLVNSFTKWIGKISYSLYLVHFVFLPYLRGWINLDGIGKTAQFSLYFLILLAISSAISFITYQVIELPSMNAGKKLIHKLEQT